MPVWKDFAYYTQKGYPSVITTITSVAFREQDSDDGIDPIGGNKFTCPDDVEECE